jgi:hypothetical protein
MKKFFPLIFYVISLLFYLLIIPIIIPNFTILHAEEEFTPFSSSSFYSLTRFFFDLKKDNSFEDLAEFKQRLFLETNYKPSEKFSILFSGKLDLNYFYGGFSRFQNFFDVHEAYFSFSGESFLISGGRKIVSWGICDGSPLDVVNRPDFRDGIFAEQKFLKTPGILLDFSLLFGSSSFQVVYEPFFTPPQFIDVKGDWAIMNWRSLYVAFEGDKNSDQLKPLLDGQFQPIVKKYPSLLSDLLKSFGLGFYFSSRLELLQIAFAGYTGFSFPLPFFDPVFSQEFARTPGSLEQKLNISAAEILEPASRGESFLKLEPKRYYMLGGGWSYDISGFLLKNDLAFFFSPLPDSNLNIKNFPIISLAFDIEKEIISNLISIAGTRTTINLSRDKIMFLERGIILPSISLRYEIYFGQSSLSLLPAFILDIPIGSPKIRGNFFVFSGSFKPYDFLEISGGLFLLSGKRTSPFGFFKDNSSIMFSVRLSF